MKDISQAVPDALEFDRALVGGLQRAVGHTVTVTTQKARSEHRWQDQTRATRESIEGEVDNTSNGATGEVGAGENAARLNDGTRPHEIRARNAKALRFQAGGGVRFARSIQHPGTKPDPFLDAAADAAGEEIERAVEHAIDEALG